MFKFFLVIIFLNISSFAFPSDNPKSEILRIIFGSCSNQNYLMKHWEYIDSYNPDYLFLLGDNVYGDFDDSEAKNLRKAYTKLANDKYFRKLRIKTKIIPIWDDHDYGINDGGKNWYFKYKAKEIFLDFFNVKATDVRRSREGIYFSSDIEKKLKIKVISLDTRTFKDDFNINFNQNIKAKYTPNYDEKKTILGKLQWDWLKQEIKKSYNILIIMSSIQVLATEHGWEKWNNFPKERKKLLDYLEDTNKLVIILSGDRHLGGMYKYNNNIYEITSSSFNQRTFNVYENDPLAVSKLVSENNFGLLEVDTENKNINIELLSGYFEERKTFRKIKLNFN